jgi:hypothetical protein
MTVYAIHEHHTLHTCPADTEPHPVIVRREVVHISEGRPCLTPVTIHIGHTTATVPCGRHVPYDRQCGPCRTITNTRQITTEYIGHQDGHQTGTGHTLVPTGLADDPCPVCGDPVAAFLGRHILCHPAPTQGASRSSSRRSSRRGGHA